MFVLFVALSVLALWVRQGLTQRTRLGAWQVNAIAGVFLGSAITGMHYTGMAAARFVGETDLAQFRTPPGSAKAQRVLPWWRRPPVIAAQVLVVLALVAASVGTVMRNEAGIAFAARDWVVVGQLTNTTREPLFDDSLDIAFRQGLAQSRHVNVLTSQQVREALARMKLDPNSVRVDRSVGTELAQREGARALLLFSNGDDLAINMQGGDLGPTVTIPVIMISQTNGALIRPVMDAETVTALIGNNFGAFPNNLNIDGFDVMVPSAASMPPQLATDASEFQVNLGGFVHNFGSEAQATGRLRAVVSQAGNELYNEVADVGNLIAGDSVLVMLPQFTQPSYSGEYTITYSVESDVPDDFEDDNSFSLPLLFSGTFSYVPVDADTDLPKAEISVLPAEFGGSFRSCVAFADTNAAPCATGRKARNDHYSTAGFCLV